MALFKGKPTALYPYSEMDADQRYYIERIVVACMDHHQKNAGALPANSPEESIEEYSKQQAAPCKVIMQMGGGCILYMEEGGGTSSRRSSSSALLNALEVMQSICDCVFASRR